MNPLTWLSDAIFGTAGTQAAGAGIANVGSSLGYDAAAGILPQAVVGETGNQMAGMIAANGMPIGETIANNAMVPGMDAANQGVMKNIQNLFGKEGFTDIFKGGMDVMNYRDAKKDSRHLRGIDNANLAMAQGKYDRDMADRDKVSSVNF